MRLATATTALLLACLPVPLLGADDPSDPSSSVDPAYRVGPGDVLEVAISGRPDLSRLVTVQTNGLIHHPLAGDVAVAGLGVEEIATRTGALLAKAGVPGQVTVQVREYNSQSVVVAGEVNRPGRQTLKSSGRLLDSLREAGGFSPAASGEVVVERHDGAFADGSTTRRFRFQSSGPTPEDLENLSLRLHPGDRITVAPRHYVKVSGAVERPGLYPLEEGMTVMKALEAAGGLGRADPRVTLERAHVIEGAPKKIEVDTRDIKAGAAPDPTLEPDDTLLVRRRKL